MKEDKITVKNELVIVKESISERRRKVEEMKARIEALKKQKLEKQGELGELDQREEAIELRKT